MAGGRVPSKHERRSTATVQKRAGCVVVTISPNARAASVRAHACDSVGHVCTRRSVLLFFVGSFVIFWFFSLHPGYLRVPVLCGPCVIISCVPRGCEYIARPADVRMPFQPGGRLGTTSSVAVWDAGRRGTGIGQKFGWVGI